MDQGLIFKKWFVAKNIWWIYYKCAAIGLHKMVIGSNDGWYIDRKAVVFACVIFQRNIKQNMKAEELLLLKNMPHYYLKQKKISLLFVYSFCRGHIC